MRSITITCGVVIFISSTLAVSSAQTSPEVATRMRPLGAPSAVDRYLQNQAIGRSPQPASSVRQVARMQSSDASPMTMPALAPSAGLSGAPMPNFTLPPSNAMPAVPPTNVVTPIGPGPNSPIISAPPVSNAPRVAPAAPQPTTTLPVNPNLNPNVSPSPLPSVPLSSAPPSTRNVPNNTPPAAPVPRSGLSNDYAPIAQPRLDGFATVDNCRNVTGPSNYRASGFFNCDPRGDSGATYTIPASYTPPPAQIAPVSTLPPAVAYPSAPVSITGTLPPVLPGSAGYRPLFSFGQENNPVQVGQGLIGQPVAYVPGQTVRNWLRYLAP